MAMRASMAEISAGPRSHGSTHAVRLICGHDDVDLLRAGRAQSLVRLGLRGRLRAGLGLRFSSRRMAFRFGRSGLVRRRAGALAREDEIQCGAVGGPHGIAKYQSGRLTNDSKKIVAIME